MSRQTAKSPFLEIKDAMMHLLFPHTCKGCGSDQLNEETDLCVRCIHALPFTCFEQWENNPIEKIFWGRCRLTSATAQFYFQKESLIQRLLHQFKYKGDRRLGHQLGKMMGESIQASPRFSPDALIPLPLFQSREKRRGYNQASILCEGIASIMNIPIQHHLIHRNRNTETQTRKGRIERWKNMEGKFILQDPSALIGQRVLLVDDVITTGATMEACANELLKTENLQLSIAALCFASH